MKMKVTTLFVALALSCSFSLVKAQGGPGDDPDPGRSIPFDGGISLVIAAGIAYAAKKGLDRKKKPGTSDQAGDNDATII